MKTALSGNALSVATSRYFMEGETWSDCCKRVATTIGMIEGDKHKQWSDIFFNMINNLDFLPAGRILRNCQRAKGSLFNCYHLPIGDSIEEIGQLIKDSLILWSDGGGVGINFSSLRPKNDEIKGKGGCSSGLVSFIEAVNSVASTIESGGSRRAAAIAHVDISHPEVMDFIDSKIIHGKLSHFNISVTINNEFLEAVESNSDWEFKFQQKVYNKVKARMLWDKIIKNMINHAEPGLINWDNMRKNNSYSFAPILGTNPCGEVPLEKYGVCCLGSLNLPNFITGSVNTNWKKLSNTIKYAIRFLDNVIDANKYTLDEISINAHNSRRIGLGIMGVAEYLFSKKLRYGSEKANLELERTMKFIRDESYLASIELAIEKGAFPKFDPIAYGKASFIRKLPASIRMKIKEHGIRNCTLLAAAPTGTISLLADVSSGIEPLFSKGYVRKDRVSERTYIHPLYIDFVNKNEDVPDWFVDSFDLEPEDHFEVQSVVQKYIDGSVSKTINLPEETTEKDLSKLLLEYCSDIKGSTVYRNNSRKGQILNIIKKEEVQEYISKNNIKVDRDPNDVQCTNGNCGI